MMALFFWGLGPQGEQSLKSRVTEQTFNLLRGQGEGDQGPGKSKQKLITKMSFYITSDPDMSTNFFQCTVIVYIVHYSDAEQESSSALTYNTSYKTAHTHYTQQHRDLNTLQNNL